MTHMQLTHLVTADCFMGFVSSLRCINQEHKEKIDIEKAANFFCALKNELLQLSKKITRFVIISIAFHQKAQCDFE